MYFKRKHVKINLKRRHLKAKVMVIVVTVPLLILRYLLLPIGEVSKNDHRVIEEESVGDEVPILPPPLLHLRDVRVQREQPARSNVGRETFGGEGCEEEEEAKMMDSP